LPYRALGSDAPAKKAQRVWRSAGSGRLHYGRILGIIVCLLFLLGALLAYMALGKLTIVLQNLGTAAGPSIHRTKVQRVSKLDLQKDTS
jgi:hypothetical protein